MAADAAAEATVVFVTFEGIEGAGKSTLMAAVVHAFEQRAVPYVATREPGGTPLGERLRAVFIDPNLAIEPWAEVFVLSAARAQLVRDVIEPALARGETVLCDRYYHAMIAYQGFGRGLDRARLFDLARMATHGVEPDLTFVIDIPPALSAARIAERTKLGARTDRLEGEGGAFHERVRNGYLAMANDIARVVVLDGTLAVPQLTAQVLQAIGVAP